MSHRSRGGLLALALMLFIASAALSAPAVRAHERRQVGDVWMIVGWKGEPALVNQPNALDLRVFRLKPGTDPAKQTTADRIGVEGLEKTLKAEIIFGQTKRELAVTRRFNDSGAYDGIVLPTATGDYTFRIFGTVEGQTVDEKFTSSPTTFGSIEDTKPMQFPQPVDSNQEIVKRLDSLSAPAGTDESDDSSGAPASVSYAGFVLGALGLVAGGVALLRKRA